MLEVVLFTPLALLFLFITIDAGLSLIQRAGIQDSFRSGIGSLPVFAKEYGATSETTEEVAQEIFDNLFKQYSMYPGANNNYYVNATLYELDINPSTGSLNNYNQIADI